MLPLDAVLPERVRRSSRSMLSAPLLGGSDGVAKGGRARWLFITVAVAVVLLLLAVLSLVVISDCTLGSWACPLYVPPDGKNDPVLVFGGGGATWSNGTTALLIATGGVFSWACPLLDGNGLALVDERAGELVAWRPGTAEPPNPNPTLTLTVSLSLTLTVSLSLTLARRWAHPTRLPSC